jgi:AcrR family transcriptional regulator
LPPWAAEREVNMKEKILDAAAELIRRYGLKKFTVDEISEELKISKKTIYKYFPSKDDIIREYFDIAITSDIEGIRQELSLETDFQNKIRSIVHSKHRYPLPVKLMSELRLYYPDEWDKVEELKSFKLNAVKELLDEGISKGSFRTDINYAVFSRMLQEISGMFVDYDFLMENKLTTVEAIDGALNILFQGILIQ